MDLNTALGLLALAGVVGAYGTIIGAGGGFVLIPGLVLLFDLAGAQAVGTGAVTLTAVGVTGAVTYDRSGLVDRPVATAFGLGSVPVALLSGWLLAHRIDAETFNGVLGALLLGLALLVVFVPPAPARQGPALAPRRGPLVAGGAGVGLLSGTFAVGGGLVTVPLLTRLQHLTPHRAAATTSATAMMSSAAGATGHTVAGNVVWDHALVLVGGAIVGSGVGARLAGRLAPRTVLLALAVGLVTAAVPLLVKAT